MTLAVNIAQSGANNVSFRNRIINGAMVIDQRNAGASVTPTVDGQYGSCDRWNYWLSQVSKFSAQQSSTAPTGFANSLLITSLSAYAVTGNDYFSVNQKIEGFNFVDMMWGTANAQTVTLSFWVRSSLTGTFGGAMTNNAFNRSYPFSYTISAANTWEQKTVTIAGDTTGTWVGATNGVGAIAQFNLGSVASKLGTANTWAGAWYTGATGAVSVVGTSGATFYITGVQLEAGTTASPFEYRQYGTELALCQRYYWRSVSGVLFNTFAIGVVDSAASCSGVYAKHPVTMRTTPTCSFSNLRLYDGTGSPAVTSLAGNWSSTESWSQGFNASGAGLTQGRAVAIQSNNSSTAFIDASAEL
jgi:hypothetical protein